MSESWSNNPNAPHISPILSSWEKENFAGTLVGSILYGVVIALFFQCMNALLNPTNRTRGSTKWGLVAHTVVLFSIETISVAIGLYELSASYIDGREFPGTRGLRTPGPFGYELLPKFTAISIVSTSVVQVNQWLFDGLLLYRCYVIYGNYWVVAFPFLMYLATWATGVRLLYAQSQLVTQGASLLLKSGNAYYSLALSLNALLTLMIIVRLILHERNIRSAMGTLHGVSGLYKTIITMLVESGALYAFGTLLLLGTWASRSDAELVTIQILPEIQIIAPFLIVLRVANRTSLTSEAIVSGNFVSIRFKSQGDPSVAGDGTLSRGDPAIDPTPDAHEGTPGEHDAGVDHAIEDIPL